MSAETSHWVSTRYRNLIREINLRKPRTILEFGTWKGRTAAKMIRVALKFRPDVFYFGIDLFECLTAEQKAYEHNGKDYCTKQGAEDYLKSQGLDSNYFILLKGESRVMFPKIRERMMKDTLKIKYFDFIYIDGGHSLETIMFDWISSESVMNDETVVIFDDYYENRDDIGARSIVEFTIPRDKFNVELLEPIDHQFSADGTPQPTQMVKVTRRRQAEIKNQGVDESVCRFPSEL